MIFLELLSTIEARAEKAGGNYGGFARQCKSDLHKLVRLVRVAVEALRHMEEWTAGEDLQEKHEIVFKALTRLDEIARDGL